MASTVASQSRIGQKAVSLKKRCSLINLFEGELSAFLGMNFN